MAAAHAGVETTTLPFKCDLQKETGNHSAGTDVPLLVPMVT